MRILIILPMGCWSLSNSRMLQCCCATSMGYNLSLRFISLPSVCLFRASVIGNGILVSWTYSPSECFFFLLKLREFSQKMLESVLAGLLFKKSS